MDTAMTTLRWLHIAAGTIALFVAPGAMLTLKGELAHRRWGKVYFWAMTLVAASAVVLGLWRPNIFLTLLALFSFYQAFSGYRSLFRKRPAQGQGPQGIDWIAAILTLRHKDVLVYKYGASDEGFHRFGAMPLLLWKAILDAKDRGLSLFDLGRTDADNSGLATFKERLGATPSTLTYVRWAEASRRISREGPHVPGAARVFARLPDELLVAAGKLFYRHMG